ncbi:hypothetical protein EJD97_012747 [Solanum chilense]|uniref:Myb-like domain-containing protein n=1 Tax=Solanum chilense TaxID=4083 RepID=A0A6N2BD72_SOLCI|nr:hypothetical protein EJD97_012747 [Solanum chilense]
MEEALPGKSLDHIKDHYNIFLEDTGAIDFGHVPLPNYLKMQSNGNKNTKTYIEWRRGTAWTEEEHMLVYCVHFLRVYFLCFLGVWLNSVETFQVPNTVDLIGPDCGGSQEVPNSGNESMFPRESTNAEHMTTVVGGEISSQNAYVNFYTRDHC